MIGCSPHCTARLQEGLRIMQVKPRTRPGCTPSSPPPSLHAGCLEADGATPAVSCQIAISVALDMLLERVSMYCI